MMRSTFLAITLFIGAFQAAQASCELIYEANVYPTFMDAVLEPRPLVKNETLIAAGIYAAIGGWGPAAAIGSVYLGMNAYAYESKRSERKVWKVIKDAYRGDGKAIRAITRDLSRFREDSPFLVQDVAAIVIRENEREALCPGYRLFKYPELKKFIYRELLRQDSLEQALEASR